MIVGNTNTSFTNLSDSRVKAEMVKADVAGRARALPLFRVRLERKAAGRSCPRPWPRRRPSGTLRIEDHRCFTWCVLMAHLVVAVNTATAAAIQSLDDRVTAELAWPQRRPWPPRTDKWPRTEAASPRCRAC